MLWISNAEWLNKKHFLDSYLSQADALHADLNMITYVLAAATLLLNLMVVFVLIKNWKLNKQIDKYLDEQEELKQETKEQSQSLTSQATSLPTLFVREKPGKLTSGALLDYATSELLDNFNEQINVRHN